MTKKIEQYIKEQEDYINRLSDFEVREKLIGFGFSVCKLIKQFYEVGTEEYEKYYCILYNKFEVRYERANKGLKTFKVNVDYRNKKGELFSWCCDSVEERTREEVLRRIKEREWYNYNTDRKIKPIFIKIEINEVNENDTDNFDNNIINDEEGN